MPSSGFATLSVLQPLVQEAMTVPKNAKRYAKKKVVKKPNPALVLNYAKEAKEGKEGKEGKDEYEQKDGKEGNEGKETTQTREERRREGFLKNLAATQIPVTKHDASAKENEKGEEKKGEEKKGEGEGEDEDEDEDEEAEVKPKVVVDKRKGWLRPEAKAMMDLAKTTLTDNFKELKDSLLSLKDICNGTGPYADKNRQVRVKAFFNVIAVFVASVMLTLPLCIQCANDLVSVLLTELILNAGGDPDGVVTGNAYYTVRATIGLQTAGYGFVALALYMTYNLWWSSVYLAVDNYWNLSKIAKSDGTLFTFLYFQSFPLFIADGILFCKMKYESKVKPLRDFLWCYRQVTFLALFVCVYFGVKEVGAMVVADLQKIQTGDTADMVKIFMILSLLAFFKEGISDRLWSQTPDMLKVYNYVPFGWLGLFLYVLFSIIFIVATSGPAYIVVMVYMFFWTCIPVLFDIFGRTNVVNADLNTASENVMYYLPTQLHFLVTKCVACAVVFLLAIVCFLNVQYTESIDAITYTTSARISMDDAQNMDLKKLGMDINDLSFNFDVNTLNERMKARIKTMNKRINDTTWKSLNEDLAKEQEKLGQVGSRIKYATVVINYVLLACFVLLYFAHDLWELSSYFATPDLPTDVPSIV